MKFNKENIFRYTFYESKIFSIHFLKRNNIFVQFHNMKTIFQYTFCCFHAGFYIFLQVLEI